MKHVKIVAFDIPDAWRKCIQVIHDSGDIFTVGYGSEASLTKKLAVSVEITNPDNRPLLDDKCPNDQKYVNEYALRYLWGLEGEPDWGRKPFEHYTYAERMRSPVDQTAYAMKRMAENPLDRQIVITIARPEDIVKRNVASEEKFEPPCLRSIHLEVLDNLVDMYTDWRSWDCVGGFPVNLAGLQMWLEGFVHGVNELAKLNATKGWITLLPGKQIANSKNLHIYAREFKWVEELLSSKKMSYGEKLAQMEVKE